MGIPFDSVDNEYIKKPRKWETDSIKSFMAYMGPLSSVFDILCFVILWRVIGANSTELAPLFQSGWFLFGTVSQVLVIHIIRTGRVPFLQSKPSLSLIVSSSIVVVVSIAVGFSRLAIGIDMMPLPVAFSPWLVLILSGYFLFAQLIKKFYIRRYKEWL
ncbi:MAG TPA: magnesium-translocating P-type ATPase, partial [Clostridiales bacterium]|nr:magnesium-translocating P-type ATPase [Clostridiales bacterium]